MLYRSGARDAPDLCLPFESFRISGIHHRATQEQCTKKQKWIHGRPFQTCYKTIVIMEWAGLVVLNDSFAIHVLNGMSVSVWFITTTAILPS